MSAELLTDPGHVRGDLVAMTAHVRSHPIEIAPAVVDAMPKVAGMLLLKGKPREQLAAGRLLLAMMEYNRARDAEPVHRSQTINVGVSVANPDAGRTLASAVLARLRDAGVPGILSGGAAGTDCERDR